MPGIKVQVTLPPAVASVLDRRAGRHSRGRAGLVVSLCTAYAHFMGARPTVPAGAGDIEGEVREMFDAYSGSEAPDYGSAAVRKHNRHE